MSNSLPSSQISTKRNAISAPLTEARDAYQLAKMRDPSIGTLDEWIASLRGAKGEKGDKGDPATYTHPLTHPASMIEDDETRRFVTDAEKVTWNAKADMSDIHAPATVSGSGIAISGQQISLSIGVGESQVAAGDHNHSFAGLTDINVPRAAPAWLRLETDGNVTERSAADTRADIGAASTNDPSFTGGLTLATGMDSAWRAALGLGAANSPTFGGLALAGTTGLQNRLNFIFDEYGGSKISAQSGLVLMSAGATTVRVNQTTVASFTATRDFEMLIAGKGIILKSPAGTRYSISSTTAANGIEINNINTGGLGDLRLGKLIADVAVTGTYGLLVTESGIHIKSNAIKLARGNVLGWVSQTSIPQAYNLTTGLSVDAFGTVLIGNGADADHSGNLKLRNLTADGTTKLASLEVAAGSGITLGTGVDYAWRAALGLGTASTEPSSSFASAINRLPSADWVTNAGWTNNGDGSYSSTNATGFNAIHTPQLPRSTYGNGVWIFTFDIIEYTSGALQPYWAPSGDIAMFRVVAAAYQVNNTFIYIATQKMDADHPILVRCDNGFVGRIGNFKLVKLF